MNSTGKFGGASAHYALYMEDDTRFGGYGGETGTAYVSAGGARFTIAGKSAAAFRSLAEAATKAAEALEPAPECDYCQRQRPLRAYRRLDGVGGFLANRNLCDACAGWYTPDYLQPADSPEPKAALECSCECHGCGDGTPDCGGPVRLYKGRALCQNADALIHGYHFEDADEIADEPEPKCSYFSHPHYVPVCGGPVRLYDEDGRRRYLCQNAADFKRLTGTSLQPVPFA